MPYKSQKDVPSAVKKLSKHKRRVWRAAFNSAYSNYKGDEEKAFATAWAAANKVSDADQPEVTLSIPLLIRLIEYGREDASDDIDVHKMVEAVAEAGANGKCLTSEDYETFATDAYNPHIQRKKGKWTKRGNNAGNGTKEISRRQVEKAKAPMANPTGQSIMKQGDSAMKSRPKRAQRWRDFVAAIQNKDSRLEGEAEYKPDMPKGSNEYGDPKKPKGDINKLGNADKPLGPSASGLRSKKVSLAANEIDKEEPFPGSKGGKKGSKVKAVWPQSTDKSESKQTDIPRTKMQPIAAK